MSFAITKYFIIVNALTSFGTSFLLMMLIVAPESTSKLYVTPFECLPLIDNNLPQMFEILQFPRSLIVRLFLRSLFLVILNNSCRSLGLRFPECFSLDFVVVDFGTVIIENFVL